MTITLDTGRAAVNGTTLYYETAGQGRPVVWLPGFALDTRMWAGQMAALAGRYRVVCYDPRGFGRSAPPTDAPYSHTADLRALLDHLGLDRICVAGLSRGGRWALQFALDYPDRVDGLIVADALPHGFPTLAETPARSAAVLAASARGTAAARRAWFNHPLFGPARRQPAVRARLWRMIADYSGWHWTHTDPLVVSQPPAAERLAEIAAPALVLIGEHDLADYHRAAEALGRIIPRARRVVIPAAGHLTNLENPAAFNAAVLDFLDRTASERDAPKS